MFIKFPSRYNVTLAKFDDSFSMQEALNISANQSTSIVCLSRYSPERVLVNGPSHFIISGIVNPTSASPATNVTYVM